MGDEAVEMINIDSGDLMTSLNIDNEKVMSGVTVAYNTYLYSDIEGKLYLHNLNNGDLKWKNDLKDLVISKALITPLHVYVQTSSDVLYAFDFQFRCPTCLFSSKKLGVTRGGDRGGGVTGGGDKNNTPAEVGYI